MSTEILKRATKENKVSIIFDDMVPDMISKKNLIQ